MSEFDTEHRSVVRFIVGIWAAAVVLGIVSIGAVVLVLWHFLAKVW